MISILHFSVNRQSKQLTQVDAVCAARNSHPPKRFLVIAQVPPVSGDKASPRRHFRLCENHKLSFTLIRTHFF